MQRLGGVTAALTEFPAEEMQLPKIEMPAQKALADPAQANGPTRSVTGTVVDQKGQPVKEGRVWLPVHWLSPFETLATSARFENSNPFVLTFPQAWLAAEKFGRMSTVWVYSPGHAIGTGSAYAQLYGDGAEKLVPVELPAAGKLTFVVLLPDGKPAVGARVMPWHLKTGRGGEIVPSDLAVLVAGTTDASGRTALPAMTRDAVRTIDVKLAGFGTQRFRCERNTNDPDEQTLQLRGAGRIEGQIATNQLELTRDMFVSVETDNRQFRNMPQAEGVAIVKVDAAGKFVIPEIASGTLRATARIDERLPVRPRMPGGLTLSQGETKQVRIPLEMTVRVHGVVRAKDTQKPLRGVLVSVNNGQGQSHQVETNESGEFSAFALPGKAYLQLVSIPKGYVQVQSSPFDEIKDISFDVKEFTWPTIDVFPSVKVTGKLLNGAGEPVPNVQLRGVIANHVYPGIGNTDKDGVFTLDSVPKDVRLETFTIWTKDKRFKGVIESHDPLVVRVRE